MKQRFFLILMLLILFWLAHHAMVYIHEWTHGTLAWLCGYKSNPFAIHYGTDWFTLWDIDEDVPYSQILADGKPGVVAAIAIAPLLIQAVIFPIGLRLLRIASLNRWVFAFFYWLTLFSVCEIYSYIPIRTFIPSGDVFNFLQATRLSAWVVAIPGTLYVLWGICRMLSREAPLAFLKFSINTKKGKWAFLSANILPFFGYYGAIGFLFPYPAVHQLSLVSCALIPLAYFYCWLNMHFRK